MKKKVRQLIRDHRRASLLSIVVSVAEKYLRAWYNEDFYDFQRNGESFVLSQFASWWGPRSLRVWDVGAHQGEWALLAHGRLPQGHITSFEMIPQIYEKMVERVGSPFWHSAVCVGLSDSERSQNACWNQKHDDTNSLSPRLGHALFDGSDLLTVSCSLITGDAYGSGNGFPDYLKIDTEGHEIPVLLGCRNFLSNPIHPQIIQFEYGSTYLPSGSTLKQVYHLLTPMGYAIGRVYPNHVDFRDYVYTDDNFRMGNFVATRSKELRQRLS